LQHSISLKLLLQNMKKILTIFPFLLALSLLLGCGGRAGLPGLVPVAGTVTLNGEPVEGALISFAPTSSDSNARSASAITDKNGKFVGSTLDYNDGMQPGEYQVFITKTTGTGGEGTDERGGGGGESARQIINHLPLKYADKGTSGLTVSIPPKGDKNIELKLEGDVDLTPQSPGGPGGSRR
jgi:hypothetical protein